LLRSISFKYNVLFILIIGILSISSASILIKICAAPALVIAFYRMAIASVFYWGATLTRGSVIKSLTGRELQLTILSGAFLALHFATWISSLNYTSVASSVVLVQTSPIFVALGSYLILKEHLSFKCILGVVITIFGGIIISKYDTNNNSSAFTGNILAIFGAIGASGYFLVGRHIRKTMDTFRYVTLVYSSAAVFLLLPVFIKSPLLFFGYDRNIYLLLFAIALIPQVIGHTSLNWALKYFSATAVAIFTLGESVCASLMAWVLLGEGLPFYKITGGFILLTGVIIVLIAENSQKLAS